MSQIAGTGWVPESGVYWRRMCLEKRLLISYERAPPGQGLDADANYDNANTMTLSHYNTVCICDCYDLPTIVIKKEIRKWFPVKRRIDVSLRVLVNTVCQQQSLPAVLAVLLGIKVRRGDDLDVVWERDIWPGRGLGAPFDAGSRRA